MSFHLSFSIPSKYKGSTQTAEASWASFNDFLKSQDSAFTILPSTEEIIQIKETRKHFSNKTKIVHIGIGGSSLGTKTIFESLLPNSDIIFLENIESNLDEVLNNVDIKETLFHIVSKSGNTTEVLAHLKIILKKFNIPESELKKHFLLTSSQLDGALNRFSKKHELRELRIPEKLGGRYSVLSPVGLLPAYFYGLDIDQFILGAKKAQRFLNEDASSLKDLASTITGLYQQHDINQTVIMPYTGKLSLFTQWFSQLWGESLGKLKDGEFIGPTPLTSLGSRDQHSLLQLYLHGPLNKLILFISLEERDFALSSVVEALQKGCELALTEVERPHCRISLTKLNESSLAELFQFFHYLTVFVASQLDIFPYDQPAVELAKKHTKKLLNFDLTL